MGVRVEDMRSLIILLLLAQTAVTAVAADSYRDLALRKPDLFHAQTGMRVTRYQAPLPDDIPGPAHVADFPRLMRLIAAGALLVDVYSLKNTRYDELDGTWDVRTPRRSIPGAIWLPETGRGALAEGIGGYLQARLAEHAAGRPVVVFCNADCWMSWNAAQRVAALGYETWWWPLGIHGWTDEGLELAPVEPLPVNVD